MSIPTIRLLAICLITSVLAKAETIRGDLVTVTIDHGRYAFHATGKAEPFASGTLRNEGALKVVPLTDRTFGRGQAITVTAAHGGGESFAVFPGFPFVVCQATLFNPGSAIAVLNKVPMMNADLAPGTSNDKLAVLGTGGLQPLAQAGGSYAWIAVADPATRAGVVGGWLTHERGSGVVFAKADGDKAQLEARLEYGCLRLEPGKTVTSESFVIGWFADARLGLEAWAGAVAKRLSIKLAPMPIVYCTWYDNVHGGASNAAAMAELSTFAAKSLKPYGLSCLQIDDGWQEGDSKGNGPRKNFSSYNPHGPYPAGMKPTADALKAGGFTAGLWILPFGGTWNDPFFAPHQDWFVKKKDDGKPFDTAWGGTALDMSDPGARDFVKGEIRQAVHDWGYHYLKLDGLSTGAGVKPQYVNDAWKEDNLGDGVFKDPNKTNIEVFRDGLRMIRETAGPGTFILGCCAPQNMRSYAGVFGLVDAMRMGPDNGGNWNSWLTSPRYGSRNYHLNGHIWWSDPDPIYVRTSIPLGSARCMASWNAIAGQMISLSDWLPTLPEERLDVIRRCIPGHGVSARPIDLFSSPIPRQWLVTDPRPGHQRRDVLGIFNWSSNAEETSIPLEGLGLPPADEYIAFDFWDRSFIDPFKGTLKLSVPGASCRILAVRPMLPHPFLLSTSRHVTQGILETKEELWDGKTKTLTGTSTVVAGDDYELRVVAQAPGTTWNLVKAEIAAADTTAGVSITSAGDKGRFKVMIKSPVSRDVTWHLGFTTTTTAPGKEGNPN